MRRWGKTKARRSSENCRMVRGSVLCFEYWPLSSSAEMRKVGADGVPPLFEGSSSRYVDCAERLLIQQ
jgi:hypothetical protein